MRLNRLSSRAFTLIELMFVIFVIALMAKVMIPRISNIFGANLKSSALMLSGYLQSAYEYAVLRHIPVRVYFDFEKGAYWAEVAQDEAPSVPLIHEESKIEDVLMEMNKKADEQAAQETPDTTVYAKISEGLLKPVLLPRGVFVKSLKFESTTDQEATWLEFSPTGFSRPAIIIMEHDSGNTMSVRLPPLGGRSLIESGEAEFDGS